MLFRKYVIILLSAIGLLSACGSAPKTIHKPSASNSKKFDKVDVPESIAADERPGYEQILFVMPKDHPERIALRGVLARSYVKSFNETSEENYKERFRLFKDALALHDPSDFAPGSVMEELVPLARWIVTRFERLGDEATVLASLRYLMLASPEDIKAEERYTELADWSESVRGTIEEQLEKYSSITNLYLRMIQLVPDREVVEHTARTILKRQKAIIDALDQIENSGGMFPPYLIRSLMREGGMSKELIYAFFLVGDPVAALGWLEEMDLGASNGSEYISLLEDMEKGQNMAENYFALAGLLADSDPRAAMRACLLARQYDDRDPRFPLCIGRSFSEMDRPESAVKFYAEAAEVAPEEAVMVSVLTLVRLALFKVHQMEKTDESELLIVKSDELVDRALEVSVDVDDDSDILMMAAALLHTSGEVEYDDGRIEASMKHFERSEKIWPTLYLSTLKQAEVHQMRGRHKKAITVLDSAVERGAKDGSSFDLWRAMLLEKRADSLSALGQDDKARVDYLDALQAWEHADIPLQQGPNAQVRTGVILDRLGKLEESQEAFRKAIRLDPDMRITYADLLSFLVARDRLEEAKEFYMIAFNQDRIEVMWKVYYSLWLDGLATRNGGKSYELARSYLEQRDGDSWQDNIARFYTGRITAEEFRKKATNKGQEVEVDYYVALKLLAGKKKEEAKPLLERVVASDLMGFYEYRMARAILQAQ